MELGGLGDGEALGGVGKGETMIEIYCMSFSIIIN